MRMRTRERAALEDFRTRVAADIEALRAQAPELDDRRGPPTIASPPPRTRSAATSPS